MNLVAVEAVFDDDPFILKEGDDAEILVRLRGTREKNFLWQRERLFNLALGHLPESCDKVCWVDCDIIFRNASWIGETSGLLEKYAVVQPFEHAIRLASGVRDLSEKEASGFSEGNREGQRCQGYVYKFVKGLRGPATTGFTWAMRRSCVSRYMLYEHMPFGGADSLIARAYVNEDNSALPARLFSNRAMKADQDSYLAGVYEAVKGSMYYAPGLLLHLWHGDESAKLKSLRHKIPAYFDFSPDSDMRVGPAGLLEWSSDKPLLRRAVEEYYSIRNEDGKFPALVSRLADELYDAQEKLKLAESRLRHIENSLPYKVLSRFKSALRKSVPTQK